MKRAVLHKHERGFTFVELLVSVAVIGILVAISSSSLGNFAARQQLSAEVNDVTRSVIEQRAKSLAGLNNDVYGVHVSSTAITFFTGDVYHSASTTNKVLPLENTSASYSFSNGLSYFSFGRLTGTTSATGTIDLYSKVLNSTTTITIYGSGLVE